MVQRRAFIEKIDNKIVMAICRGKDERGIGEAVAGGQRGTLIKPAGGDNAAAFPVRLEQEKIELA